MNKSPFFSIILPTWNCGDNVKTAVQSIFHQTFTEWELIILDNCSTDSTVKTLESFTTDRRIRLYSEKDKGIYDAMNKGIRLATGNYVYFMGSDDYLLTQHVLQSVYDKLVPAQPDILVCYICRERGMNLYGGFFDYKRLFHENVPHQGAFYVSNVIKQSSFSLDYPILADFDLNIRLFSRSLLFSFADVVVCCHGCSGISNTSIDHNFQRDHHRIHKESFGFVKHGYCRTYRKTIKILKSVLALLSRLVSIFKVPTSKSLNSHPH